MKALKNTAIVVDVLQRKENSVINEVVYFYGAFYDKTITTHILFSSLFTVFLRKKPGEKEFLLSQILGIIIS